jgi:hypothetical protein
VVITTFPAAQGGAPAAEQEAVTACRELAAASPDLWVPKTYATWAYAPRRP